MENVIIAVYKQESTPFQVLSDLKNRSGQSEVSVAGIIQNVSGSIVVKDGWTNMAGSASWASGGLVGTLVGILGGPVGMLLGAGVGMLVGSALDTGDMLDQAGLIESVAHNLQDGNLALILIAEEASQQELDGFLQHYGHVAIHRQSAEQVQAEIAQAEETTRALQKEARAQMRAQRKESLQHKAHAIKDKAKEDFVELKELVKS